ncbi:hypothetical protein GC163_09690 [bacterium]|nr:hypothetical protein [bacterium]
MMPLSITTERETMSVATTDDLLDKLSECLMVDRNKLSLDTKAEDIDIWDSMGVVEIVFMLQREYGVSLSPDDAYKITSVQAVVDILRDARKLA